MIALPPNTRVIPAMRGEQIRVRLDIRDAQKVVRLDLLQPLTSHAAAMTVTGRPLMIPVGAVDKLIDAIRAASEAAPPAPKRAARGAP